jgi:hypothetical protein
MWHKIDRWLGMPARKGSKILRGDWAVAAILYWIAWFAFMCWR